MRPTRRPILSTTGIATRSYFSIVWTTSSIGVSTRTEIGSFFITCFTFDTEGLVIIFFNGNTPRRRSSSSTTYKISSISSACRRISFRHSGILQFSFTTTISVPMIPPAVSSSYFNKSTISPAWSMSSMCERISSCFSSSISRMMSTASSVSMWSRKRFAMVSGGRISRNSLRTSSSISIKTSAAVSLSSNR